jgi:hypothetical protein
MMRADPAPKLITDARALHSRALPGEGLTLGAQVTRVSDDEDGFIVWIAPSGGVYCRFWDKENPRVLRSVRHSERCEATDLVLRETHTRDEVSAAIMKHCQRL